MGRHSVALGSQEVHVGRGEAPLEGSHPGSAEAVLGVVGVVPRVVVVGFLVGARGRLEERVEQVVGDVGLVEGSLVVPGNPAVFVPAFAVPVPRPGGLVELVRPRLPLRAGPLPLRTVFFLLLLLRGAFELLRGICCFG